MCFCLKIYEFFQFMALLGGETFSVFTSFIKANSYACSFFEAHCGGVMLV